MITKQDLQQIATELMAACKLMYMEKGVFGARRVFLDEDLNILLAGTVDKQGNPIDVISADNIDDVDDPKKQIMMATLATMCSDEYTVSRNDFLAVHLVSDDEQLFVSCEIIASKNGIEFGECKEYPNGIRGFQNEYAPLSLDDKIASIN